QSSRRGRYQVLAPLHREHYPVNQVVHVHESTRLFAGSLDREPNRVIFLLAQPPHSQDELRYYVLPAHVRTVDVVWTKDDDPLEVRPTMVDSEELADHLRTSIGVAWVQRVGNGQRYRLVGRNRRRRLVYL